MKHLRLTSSLAALIIGYAACPAWAATTISTSTTAPVQTSNAGDTTMASGGSITTGAGAAITVDSANSVSINTGGTLNANPADNSGGILVRGGVTTTISNDGKILVTESYSVAPITGTSVASGPIANTNGRFGILVSGAAGGSITNTGTISVKGLRASGIQTAGTWDGSITNTGTISVKGDNSTGILTQAVTGNLVAGGSISVVGQGAQALVSQGDVGGAVSIQGTLSQQTSYTTDAGATQSLSAAALRGGAAAVEIDGNVAGGISVFAVCTATTVSGVSSCTSTGSSATTSGLISSVGNSPALQIGGARNTTIAAQALSNDGNRYSLVIDGGVAASASYSATDAFGVVIGGRGGAVNMPGGIGISGTVSASSIDASATALLVNSGSNVPALTNNGAIRASLSQAGGTAAYGVRDLSGTLTSVVNHGIISASAGLVNTAIDLSANTGGVTVTQSLSAFQQAQQVQERAASTYNAANAVVYTSITGDIRTGSGNDLIDIRSGKVTGNAWLGGGTDQVKLSNDAVWTGDLHFGGGSGTVALSGTAAFTGGIDAGGQPVTLTIADTASAVLASTLGAGRLAVAVNGGSFGVSRAVTVQVASLSVATGGTITAYTDGSAGTSSLIQAGTATFASGTKVAATISSLTNAPGTYRILTAGTLSGNPQFDATQTKLPVLFNGTVSVRGNDLYLVIARKSASDLGLTSSQAAGYEAIYANAQANQALATSLLQVADAAALKGQMNQLLPDHAGGAFDFVSRAARLSTRRLTDNTALFTDPDLEGYTGLWLEPIYFHGSKAASGTAPWSNHGFGLSTGFEKNTGLGNVGVSFVWTGGGVDNGTWQHLSANDYEVAGFWRTGTGPFYAFAKVGANFLSVSSTRSFTGSQNGTALLYSATARWKGTGWSGNAGASYKLPLSSRFAIKPMAVFDWLRLREKGYSESGSSVTDLTVDRRKSTQASVATTLTASWSLGQSDRDTRPLTFEFEGGRRNHLSGGPGATTARFANGSPFTITPEAAASSWLGEARLLAGGYDYTWQLGAGAERVSGKTAYTVRAALSIAL